MSKFAKEKQDSRMKDYKPAFTAGDFRKRREETIISVRKQRREENILKRRNMESVEVEDPSKNMLLLPEYVEHIYSGDLDLQLLGTSGIRKLLSIQVHPPIEEVIKTGCLPRIVTFLRRADCPKLQFEAAWTLTNIASGTTTQTFKIIEAGAISAFVEQLNSTEVQVREQAVWALGNIAGDSYICRDILLKEGVLNKLLPLTELNVKLSLKRNVVWAISNLCRGKPSPPFGLIAVAIPYLARIIMHGNDLQVVTDACWAISYISDGDNQRIQAVIESGICERVVMFLMHPSLTIMTPALRVIGNIVTGTDEQTQLLLDYQVLPRLKNMLDNPQLHKPIKKEVCWAISNITAGPPNQIQTVINENIIESLIHQLQYADFDVKKEAAWAIANATSSGTPEQIHILSDKGCIKYLCDMLELNDPRIIAVALEGLENILAKGEIEVPNGLNPHALTIEDVGGVGNIEMLQNHSHNVIASKAESIITKYYGGATDEDDSLDDIAPIEHTDSFAFGADNSHNHVFNFGSNN